MMELKKVTGNAQVRARLIHPYPAADVVARKRGIHGYNILTEKWSLAQVTFMVNNRCNRLGLAKVPSSTHSFFVTTLLPAHSSSPPRPRPSSATSGCSCRA